MIFDGIYIRTGGKPPTKNPRGTKYFYRNVNIVEYSKIDCAQVNLFKIYLFKIYLKYMNNMDNETND